MSTMVCPIAAPKYPIPNGYINSHTNNGDDDMLIKQQYVNPTFRSRDCNNRMNVAVYPVKNIYGINNLLY